MDTVVVVVVVVGDCSRLLLPCPCTHCCKACDVVKRPCDVQMVCAAWHPAWQSAASQGAAFVGDVPLATLRASSPLNTCVHVLQCQRG